MDLLYGLLIVLLLAVPLSGRRFVTSPKPRPVGSNVISSTNYPENYNNNENHSWKISVPYGNVIQITIEFMDIEYSTNCLFDKLSIFDLVGTNILYEGCGHRDDQLLPIVSSSNRIRVHFQSDTTVTRKGFLLRLAELKYNASIDWKVEFFTGPRHTGQHTLVKGRSPNACVNLADQQICEDDTASCGNFTKHASSIDTRDTCVRLYAHKNCTGNPVMELRPGTLCHEEWEACEIKGRVVSVAGCPSTTQGPNTAGIMASLSLNGGSIQSTDHPKSENQNWIITVPYGQRLQITMGHVQTYDEATCQYEKLTLYELVSNEVIYETCGKKKIGSGIVSASNQVRVNFITEGGTASTSSFKLSWKSCGNCIPTEKHKYTVVPRESCRNENGKPVDFFIAYKLPSSYFYYVISGDRNRIDSICQGRYGVNEMSSVFSQTLSPIYQEHSPNLIDFVMWNNEQENSAVNSTETAAKGILAFNRISSGFLVIHTFPNFPLVQARGYGFPESGKDNAEIAICLSFHNSPEMHTKTIHNIIQHATTFAPQVNDLRISNTWPKYFVQDLNKLLRPPKTINDKTTPRKPIRNKISIYNSYLSFDIYTTGRSKDPYDMFEYLADCYQASLYAQTWEHQSVNICNRIFSSCERQYTVENMGGKMVGNHTVFRLHDHSSWAISKPNFPTVTCVGDLHREKSAMQRGGMFICTTMPEIHNIFREFRAHIDDEDNCDGKVMSIANCNKTKILTESTDSTDTNTVLKCLIVEILNFLTARLPLPKIQLENCQ